MAERRTSYFSLTREEAAQLDAYLLARISEIYAIWYKQRQYRDEPMLSVAAMVDEVIHGGTFAAHVPKEMNHWPRRYVTPLVRTSLERMRRKNKIASSTGIGKRGRDARVYEPIDRERQMRMNEAFDPHVLLRQLGGNKFKAMTGAKNFVFSKTDRSLSFRIGRNSKRVNAVRIKLDASDTYTMEFLWVAKKKGELTSTKRASVSGVYAEDLQRVFTEHTGMYTSLGTMGESVKVKKGTKVRLLGRWTTGDIQKRHLGIGTVVDVYHVVGMGTAYKVRTKGGTVIDQVHPDMVQPISGRASKAAMRHMQQYDIDPKTNRPYMTEGGSSHDGDWPMDVIAMYLRFRRGQETHEAFVETCARHGVDPSLMEPILSARYPGGTPEMTPLGEAKAPRDFVHRWRPSDGVTKVNFGSPDMARQRAAEFNRDKKRKGRATTDGRYVVLTPLGEAKVDTSNVGKTATIKSIGKAAANPNNKKYLGAKGKIKKAIKSRNAYVIDTPHGEWRASPENVTIGEAITRANEAYDLDKGVRPGTPFVTKATRKDFDAPQKYLVALRPRKDMPFVFWTGTDFGSNRDRAMKFGTETMAKAAATQNAVKRAAKSLVKVYQRANEATDPEVLYQEANDTYAVVIGTLKNRAKKVLKMGLYDRKPKQDSTSGWYPKPTTIPWSDVPPEYQRKFMAELKKRGLQEITTSGTVGGFVDGPLGRKKRKRRVADMLNRIDGMLG